MYAFKLSEITAMQFECIKQLNGMLASITKDRTTRQPRRGAFMESHGDVTQDIKLEIAQRKYWAMHPEEIRV